MLLFLQEMWQVFETELNIQKRSLKSGTLYERFIQLLHEHYMKELEA